MAYGTLLNVVWQPGWEGSLGENGYMYVYGCEILCCPPETITSLLMAILQNKIKSFLLEKKSRD